MSPFFVRLHLRQRRPAERIDRRTESIRGGAIGVSACTVLPLPFGDAPSGVMHRGWIESGAFAVVHHAGRWQRPADPGIPTARGDGTHATSAKRRAIGLRHLRYLVLRARPHTPECRTQTGGSGQSVAGGECGRRDSGISRADVATQVFGIQNSGVRIQNGL